jgi:hypothetical protein
MRQSLRSLRSGYDHYRLKPGIGRAAEIVASPGAKIVVSSRELDACEDVVAAIQNKEGDAIAISCNISQNEIEDLVVRPA